MSDTVYEYVHEPNAMIDGESTIHLVSQETVMVDGVNAKTLCGRLVLNPEHKTVQTGDETISFIRATCGTCRRIAGSKRDAEHNARLNNEIAKSGCDRCFCGCKYWKDDHCIDCDTSISEIPEGPGGVRDGTEVTA